MQRASAARTSTPMKKPKKTMMYWLMRMICLPARRMPSSCQCGQQAGRRRSTCPRQQPDALPGGAQRSTTWPYSARSCESVCTVVSCSKIEMRASSSEVSTYVFPAVVLDIAEQREVCKEAGCWKEGEQRTGGVGVNIGAIHVVREQRGHGNQLRRAARRDRHEQHDDHEDGAAAAEQEERRRRRDQACAARPA